MYVAGATLRCLPGRALVRQRRFGGVSTLQPLAKLAREHGKTVTGFCGVADEEARESGVFDGLHALADSGLPVEVLIERAAPLLTEAVVKSDFLRP